MEDNIQLMDNYLQGTLDKEGLKAFDTKLKQEPKFESDFRDMRAVQTAAKASVRLTTLANLERLEASIKEKEATKINYTMKKLVTVAASLILIATVGYFTVFNQTNVTSGPNIYNEFYTYYRNMESTIERGDASALVTLKDRAYFAYDSKDFIRSAALFSEVLKTEQTAANYFYAGISNLEIGEHYEATKNLNTVTNNYEDLVAQSQWYLALNLLKENTETSKDEAMSSLVELALGESSFKSDAEAVLAKMDVSLAREGDGVIIIIHERPTDDDAPAPDGISEEVDSRGKRRFQWGQVVTPNGNMYRFFNDNPIDGIEAGDAVQVIVLREAKGKSKMGFAFIV
jgi:hypothetical protein